MTRYPITTASIALAALLALAPVQAAIQGTVIIESNPSERGYNTGPIYQVIPAPPPLRYEAVPPNRRGKVWQEGHWEWRGNRHHWTKGHWVKARDGYQYRQPQWIEREGRWELRRGDWDRDGIANRNDRDRDGDGVRNRMDRHPDNPRRH